MRHLYSSTVGKGRSDFIFPKPCSKQGELFQNHHKAALAVFTAEDPAMSQIKWSLHSHSNELWFVKIFVANLMDALKIEQIDRIHCISCSVKQDQAADYNICDNICMFVCACMCMKAETETDTHKHKHMINMEYRCEERYLLMYHS